MGDLKFYRKPFAISGDVAEVPDDIDPDGSVSYETGFGFDYERNIDTDANAKDIARPDMNKLLYDITSNLRQFQTYGVYPYITPEQNSGKPFSYFKSARCLYDAGSGLAVYESQADGNTSLPTDTQKWRRVNATDFAPAAGTINTKAPLISEGTLGGGVTLSARVATTTASGLAPRLATNDEAAKRTGNGLVCAAQLPDTVSGWNDIAGKPATFPPAAHNHDAGNITSGTLPIARGGTGANTAAGAVANLGVYFLCEFYYFRHPTLKPGFQAAQGGVIANAATTYPAAWAYLQSTAGKVLCKTEAEWQALTQSTWATLADGTKVGWNGIGGAPFYVVDTAKGTLRLPDLRGMYAEAAGFDSLGVGGAHGDGMRNVVGHINNVVNPTGVAANYSGPFFFSKIGGAVYSSGGGAAVNISFDISRVVPTASKNQPRAWGALACVYLGAPK